MHSRSLELNFCSVGLIKIKFTNMAQWENIGSRWTVGLDELGGIFSSIGDPMILNAFLSNF